MSRMDPRSAQQRIVRHLAWQSAMIVAAGVLWYLVGLEVVTTWSSARHLAKPQPVEAPHLDPATVLALAGFALAIGGFGQRQSVARGFPLLTAR